MNNATTTYRTVADTAKLIRADLKAAFAGVKFSVKSRSYSMGSEVMVSWFDGPTSAAVDQVVCEYREGSRHVDVTRRMSEATRQLIEDAAVPAEVAHFMEWDRHFAISHVELFASRVFSSPSEFPRTAQRAGLVAA